MEEDVGRFDDEVERVPCPACRNGKTTIQISGSDEGRITQLLIDCVHCDGESTLTLVERASYDRLLQGRASQQFV
jgi:hypothetical protein